jgi:L-lactate utilization protein LutB
MQNEIWTCIKCQRCHQHVGVLKNVDQSNISPVTNAYIPFAGDYERAKRYAKSKKYSAT